MRQRKRKQILFARNVSSSSNTNTFSPQRTPKCKLNKDNRKTSGRGAWNSSILNKSLQTTKEFLEREKQPSEWKLILPCQVVCKYMHVSNITGAEGKIKFQYMGLFVQRQERSGKLRFYIVTSKVKIKFLTKNTHIQTTHTHTHATSANFSETVGLWLQRLSVLFLNFYIQQISY